MSARTGLLSAACDGASSGHFAGFGWLISYRDAWRGRRVSICTVSSSRPSQSGCGGGGVGGAAGSTAASCCTRGSCHCGLQTALPVRRSVLFNMGISQIRSSPGIRHVLGASQPDPCNDLGTKPRARRCGQHAPLCSPRRALGPEHRDPLSLGRGALLNPGLPREQVDLHRHHTHSPCAQGPEHKPSTPTPGDI